jgi:ribonuclease-3
VNSFEFQRVIDYKFNNVELLETALTHSSCNFDVKNKEPMNNERLEFLGDAFLDAIISEYLFNQLNINSEGLLSKTRASIVCEKSLAEIGKNLKIGEYIKLGRGEELTGGRNRDSIIADSVEAIIGAIYLDSGYMATKEFILSYFDKNIKEAIQGKFNNDYKTKLQEKLQINGEIKIEYLIEKEEGPAHNKMFYIKLMAGGKEIGLGSGKSKKEAEQAAAKNALERGVKVVF